MFRYIFDLLVSGLFGLLVMIMNFRFGFRLWVSWVNFMILWVLFEFEINNNRLFFCRMFRLLCCVLLGCRKIEGILVE